MSKVISLEDFKNKGKPLEFAWSFDPTKFYPIHFKDLDRIFELLSFSPEHSAIFKYRSIL